MRKVAAALGLTLAILSACDSGQPEDRVFRPPGVTAAEDATGGKELYLRDCAWCHAGDGTGTDRGPEILSAPNGPAFVDFVLSTGRMPLDHPDERMTRQDPIYSETEIQE